MAENWATRKVTGEYDHVSPGGTTEIWQLPSFEQGEIAYGRTLPNRIARSATLSGIGELFYVVSGEGELWRKTGDLEDVTPLVPQRCVSIPPGIAYQYRALGRIMDLLVLTAPRWRRENWHEAETRCWDENGDLVSTAARRAGPWLTIDLSPGYNYLAPDGSEIRLLLTYDGGGLAHCRLPAGHASAPVRHRTVVEVWYVLGGRGQVWRADAAEDEVVDVEPGMGLNIPVGTRFQFRAADDAALEIVIGTFPKWPGATEAEPVEGRWPATAA